MRANGSLEFPETRASLLRRLRRLSDQGSWDEFFVIYCPLIYAVARHSQLSHEEAQDVVQDAMVRMTKKLPQFNYEPTLGSFRSWIRITTRWCIIQQIRRRLPNFVCSVDENDNMEKLEDLGQEVQKTTFDQIWEKEESLSQIRIATQRAKQRASDEIYQIYDCLIHKGWSPRKTASLLRTNVPKVYVAKCRFLRLLRVELNKLRAENSTAVC